VLENPPYTASLHFLYTDLEIKAMCATLSNRKPWDSLRCQPANPPIQPGRWTTQGLTPVEFVRTSGNQPTKGAEVRVGYGVSSFTLQAASMIELGEFLIALGNQIKAEK